MSFDKDLVKQQLDIEDISSLLEELGGEPEIYDDKIVSKTICHNGNSHNQIGKYVGKVSQFSHQQRNNNKGHRSRHKYDGTSSPVEKCTDYGNEIHTQQN